MTKIIQNYIIQLQTPPHPFIGSIYGAYMVDESKLRAFLILSGQSYGIFMEENAIWGSKANNESK